MADGSIAVTLLNGCLRSGENLEMARLLRLKSRLLVAFGSCADGGGVPALANEASAAQLLSRICDTAADAVPGQRGDDGTFSPELPAPSPLLPRVHAVAELVDVDYVIPGCPPEPDRLLDAIRTLGMSPLPPRGTVLGCTSRSVCDDCPREKRNHRPQRLVRSCAIIPEEGWCLLEQGIACMGMATRGGCGALCPTVHAPCTGCYGTLDPDAVPVAASLSALSAAVLPDIPHPADDRTVRELYRAALSAVADPLGTLCRYDGARNLAGGTGQSGADRG